jgi:hypothetical protein
MDGLDNKLCDLLHLQSSQLQQLNLFDANPS